MPPQIDLQPGSTNTQAVKQLQDYLVSQGVMTQAQVNTGYGTYGPQTKAAVSALQQKLGVNAGANAGYYGPLTQQAISKAGSSSTQGYTQAQYDAAVAAHPTIAPILATGKTVSDINKAVSTGDYSNLTPETGQPYTAQDQADAVTQATAALAGGQQEMQAGDTASTENSLAKDQLDYNNYLGDQATQFQTDKTAQDQTAANNGVLFSGGRAQKLQQLGATYARNDAYNQAKYGNSIAGTADSYAQKYGSSAAGNTGLSQYYNLGSNSYNPNVARGGVTSGGLSSIYNPGASNYQGSQNALNSANIQQRAAGLLANKTNKLAGSYNTQL